MEELVYIRVWRPRSPLPPPPAHPSPAPLPPAPAPPPRDVTLVHHSENSLVAKGSCWDPSFSGWLCTPDSEESTFLLDGANLHGENVASSDECSSAAPGECSTDDYISRPDVSLHSRTRKSMS